MTPLEGKLLFDLKCIAMTDFLLIETLALTHVVSLDYFYTR